MKLLNFAAIGVIVIAFNLSADEMETPNFANLDKDGDGYISIVEATGHTEILRNWSALDLDSDGKIELSEFSAFEIREAPAEFYVPPEVSPEPGAALF